MDDTATRGRMSRRSPGSKRLVEGDKALVSGIAVVILDN